jgi:YfiH family protein
MTWNLASKNGIEYFKFVRKECSALYSTKIGQDSLIQQLNPVFLRQIHSAIIIDVESSQARTGDGLIGSRERHLGIKIADCLPVYAFSQDRIAILHCGWRGIIAGITWELKRIFKDFRYLLGASIGPCCYEVKQDVVDLFRQDYNEAILLREGKYYLDLKSAVIKDLGSEALLGSLDLCTKCHPGLFYSNRRSDTGRNFAAIGDLSID